MASLLLLLMMLATASSLLTDDYMFKVSCNGNSYGTTRYCYLDDIGQRDLDYYEIDLLNDHSSPSKPGCQKGYYALVRRNNRAAVRVYLECYGDFGIKPKVRGYPYKGQCGQNNNAGFKIVRGHKAYACQFPWMAFVKLDWRDGYRSSCGGSIVHNKWILTAAHCVILQGRDGRLPPASAMYVRTGSLDKFANFIQRDIDWLVTHPSFDHRTLKYDIALLRLTKPIKWDGCHAPVCLNNDTNIDTNLTCMISGWGKLGLSGSWPRELYWAYDQLLTRDRCDTVYGSHSTDNTLCGRGTISGYGGFCTADSGGPLVCRSRQDNRYYQHGIVSAYLGHRVCSMEGLYTNVAAFRNWIGNYVR